MKVSSEMSGKSAREFALQKLKEKIISLEIRPNSMVSEKEIADEIGLSRTPIREAMIELSKSQIFRIIPQKGCYVPKISYKLVNEARFLRQQLEKGILEELCQIEHLDLELLKNNVKLQSFYVDQEDAAHFFELDNEFHRSLFVLSEKEVTYQLVETMQVHFDRIRRMNLETIHDARVLLEDHIQLLEALENKNTEGAVEILERHLSRYQINKEQIKEKYGDLFEEEEA